MLSATFGFAELPPAPPLQPFGSAAFEAALRSFPQEHFQHLPPALDPFRQAYLSGQYAEIPTLCESRPAIPQRNPPREDIPLFLCAVGAFSSGSSAEAEALIRRSFDARAASSDALVLIGYLALQRSDFKAAQTYFQEASWFQRYRFLSPGFAPYFLGRILLQQGRLTDASTWLQRAVQLQPESSEARIALSELRRTEGNTAQALAVLREGTQKNPADLRLRLALVDTLLDVRSGALDDASNREISSLLGDAPPTDAAYSEQIPDYFALSVERALRRNELAQAAAVLKEARKRFPQDATFARLQQDYETQARLQASKAPASADSMTPPPPP